jgi:DNA-binding NarL/FixJ family response regulator
MDIRVSVVEDHERTRNALKTLLGVTPGFRCVSVHATAEEALQQIPKAGPDVVVVDLKLTDLGGVELLRQLHGAHPKLQCLVLTQFDDTDLIFGALQAGADGYILKRTPPAELLEAIRVVFGGGSAMTPSVARRVLNYFQQLPAADSDSVRLSEREMEVLHLAKKGLTYEKIGKELCISFNTVRTHFRNIYSKLEVTSRAEAVARYFRL